MVIGIDSNRPMNLQIMKHGFKKNEIFYILSHATIKL